MMVTSVTKADPPFLRPRLHSGESGVSFQAHVVQCERAAPVWRFRSPHQFLQRGGGGKRFSPKRFFGFLFSRGARTAPVLKDKAAGFSRTRRVSAPFSSAPAARLGTCFVTPHV